jgi:hypothetical protein
VVESLPGKLEAPSTTKKKKKREGKGWKTKLKRCENTIEREI